MGKIILFAALGIIAIPIILGSFLFPSVWKDSRFCLDKYNTAIEKNTSSIKTNILSKEQACIEGRDITSDYSKCVDEFITKDRIPEVLISTFTANKLDELKRAQNEICRNYPEAIIP